MATPHYADVYNKNNEIVSVELTEEIITVCMCDGRRVSAPLKWFAWLQNATFEQRGDYRIYGSSIYWDQLDEGMSIEPFLLGLPPNSKK